MKITLNETEYQACKEFTELRSVNSTNLKNARGYKPDSSDSEKQLFSNVAEYGVAKILGLEPQFQLNAFGQPDIVCTGRRGNTIKISVKSSQNGRNLLVPPNQLHDEGWCYVGVTGQGATCDVLGYATAIQIRTSGEFTTLGNPNRPPIYAFPNTLLKTLPSGIYANN